jgi:hypothetical protein
LRFSSIGGGSPTCSNRYAFDWKRTINSQSAEAPCQPIDNAHENISSNSKSDGVDETPPSEVTEIIEENDMTRAGAAPVQEVHYTRAGAAHEPLKEPLALLGRGEREKDFSAACGFAAPLKKEEELAKFSELCDTIWIRPYGTDRKVARKAFVATCEEHGDRVRAEHASTSPTTSWPVRGTGPPRRPPVGFPNSRNGWLANEAWRNEPAPDKGGDRGGGESAGERLLRRAGVR